MNFSSLVLTAFLDAKRSKMIPMIHDRLLGCCIPPFDISHPEEIIRVPCSPHEFSGRRQRKSKQITKK
jgi:hypothetical protein